MSILTMVFISVLLGFMIIPLAASIIGATLIGLMNLGGRGIDWLKGRRS